jgi:glycosyltransferase involved in cell wall biosynthesis
MWQAVDLLLEALHELRLEGMDLSLVVVGDGIMYETWRSQAQSLSIDSNVTFVGRVPWLEVPEYIAGFDVCYTGQVEIQQVGKMYHSPLKLYEYMAMAKPVVASAFEDAKRMLQEGETDFYLSKHREDLKRALTRAYKLKEQLPLLGQQAREAVLTQHSWVARVKL